MNSDSTDRDLFKLLQPLTLRPKEITESLKKGTPKSSSNYEKGLRARARGDFLSAIGLYRMVLFEDPDHFSSRINLGVCLIKLGLLKEAISNFKKAETIKDEDNIARFNLVLCHIHLHEYRQALEVIKRALLQVSFREELLKLRALVLLRQGDLSGARKVLNNETGEENKINKGLSIMNIEAQNFEADELVINSRNSSVSMKNRPKSSRNTKAFMDFLGFGNSFSCKYSKNRESRKLSVLDSFKNDSTPKTRDLDRQMRVTSAKPKLSIRKKKSFLTSDRIKPSAIISIDPSKPKPSLKPESSSEMLHSIIKRSTDYDIKIQERESQLKELVPFATKANSKLDNLFQDGFVQEEVEQSYKPDLKLIKNFDNKFKHFKEMINKEEYTKAYIRPSLKELDTLEKIKRNSLRFKSLNYLVSEYKKETDDRNYIEMSNIVQKLSFFSKFAGGIRIMVLKIAQFKFYSKGDTVICEGDHGDSMFVIIQGSIVVEKKPLGIELGAVVVQTLYDGDQFGELALLTSEDTTVTRRNATCRAGEDSYLLSISKQDYHNVLLKLMRNDIEGRIKFLQSLKLFVDVEMKNLIPLASNLSSKVYKVNDVILAQGQMPEGLYIIYRGHCRVYKEGKCNRPTEVSEYANPKIRKPPLRNFIIGNYTPSENSNNIAQPQSQHQSQLNPKPQSQSQPNSNPKPQSQSQSQPQSHKRVFSARSTGPLSQKSSVISRSYREAEESFYTTNEKILFADLQEGDFFGGRKMLEGDYPPIDGNLYLDDDVRINTKPIVIEPSKFTIIAETVEVELFILTKKHFSLLTDDMIVIST